MKDISGMVAITGAGMGLGLAMTVEWARRGARVLALIHQEEQRTDVVTAVAELSGTVDIEVLDVTAPGDFTFPADVEVLVNNAAIRLKNLPIEEVPIDEWRLYMEVNFLGAVELTRRAIKPMRERRRGVFVFINSSGLTVPVPFLGPYRAAKGAMAAFAETLCTEVTPFGIRVLEILPGSVRTGLSSTSMTTRPPEALGFPAYAELARNVAASGPGAGEGAEIVDAALAAERIVDAVASGDGRFRYGTDARSEQAIEAWRAGGGEPLIAQYIAGLNAVPDTAVH